MTGVMTARRAVAAAALAGALTSGLAHPASADPLPGSVEIARVTPGSAMPPTPPRLEPLPGTGVLRSLGEVLDLPAVNASAEGNGGYHPALPTDPGLLGALLDRARADRLPPARYATLLAQYWLSVGSEKAGLEPNNWDPTLGVEANQGNLARTFSYYQRLQRENPDFLWTGQGGLAGPSFAAGTMDVTIGRQVLEVREVRAIVADLAGRLEAAAAPAVVALPEDVASLLQVGNRITDRDIADFEVRVVAMSKHIYQDLIPQHEAYLAGGLAAIDEYRAAGLIDDTTREAWRLVDTGDPDAVVAGNAMLLHREQFDVIGDQWDAARAAGGPVGRALTYLATVAADPAIPGIVPPREYAPLTLGTADLGGAEPPPPRWRMVTPLPAFNWSVREERWRYIEEVMLPTYRSLKDTRPDVWRAALERPMDEQFLRQRAAVRLPDMLASMARVTYPVYG